MNRKLFVLPSSNMFILSSSNWNSRNWFHQVFLRSSFYTNLMEGSCWKLKTNKCHRNPRTSPCYDFNEDNNFCQGMMTPTLHVSNVTCCLDKPSKLCGGSNQIKGKIDWKIDYIDSIPFLLSLVDRATVCAMSEEKSFLLKNPFFIIFHVKNCWVWMI